jgi:hypothetical protein
MTARNICYVNESNPIKVLFQLLNQVTEGALLMIKIAQHLDTLTSHLPDYFESLGDRSELNRRILQRINRLDHELKIIVGSQIGSALQVFNRCQTLSLGI